MNISAQHWSPQRQSNDLWKRIAYSSLFYVFYMLWMSIWYPNEGCKAQNTSSPSSLNTKCYILITNWICIENTPKKILHSHRKEQKYTFIKAYIKAFAFAGVDLICLLFACSEKASTLIAPFQHSSWETFFLLCIKALIALQNCVISPLLIYWKWKNWKFL